MTISSGLYEDTGNKRTVLNGQFFLFIMLKCLVRPVESERARSRSVECTLTQFAILVLHVTRVRMHTSYVQFTEAFR